MNKTLNDMPEFLSTKDLVDLGIFASESSAYAARKRGYGPIFIKCNHAVLYQRAVVIKWLESRKSKINRRWRSDSTIDGVA